MGGKYEGKNFFYTGHDPELKDVRLDWLGKLKWCYKIVVMFKAIN